jgi:uncharacterized protein YjiS (DUF1127 family)
METMTSGITLRPGRSAGFAAGLLAGAIDRLLLWQERARDRRALAGLDNHMLRDIGLSRADLEAEVVKPFWRS